MQQRNNNRKRSMTDTKRVRVTDLDGLQGTVERSSLASDNATPVLVQLDSGERILVPRELLSQGSQNDGQDDYVIGASLASLLKVQEREAQELEAQGFEVQGLEARDNESLVIPVIEEVPHVERVARKTGKVELTKTVEEWIEHIDEPLASEEVEVERVTVNRPVDEAPTIRHEGDTLVIPLLEEVLVVQKQLVLREEVRVRKLRREVHAPQEVSLRRERIDVTRKPASPPDTPMSESVDEPRG
jgi:uncharacterized protein (TIGR02271 family)